MPLDSTNWAKETDETTEVLIRARSFLERGWCKNALARDKNGNFADPKASNAVSWCIYGALDAAGSNWRVTNMNGSAENRLIKTIQAVGIAHIALFNNQQETVKPILDVFDRAIAGE